MVSFAPSSGQATNVLYQGGGGAVSREYDKEALKSLKYHR